MSWDVNVVEAVESLSHTVKIFTFLFFFNLNAIVNELHVNHHSPAASTIMQALCSRIHHSEC